MTREPAEPLRLDYLIRASAIHSMTGEQYRSTTTSQRPTSCPMSELCCQLTRSEPAGHDPT
jgi:hypothetical protein